MQHDRAVAHDRPLLAFDLAIVRANDTVGLERGDEVFEVAGLDPALIQRALWEMRGDRTIGEIAAASGLNVPHLLELCDRLAAAELLTRSSEDREICAAQEILTPEALVEACQICFERWKIRLFSGELWTQLATGTAERPIFLGWLIESYFFIEAVTARLPTAIAGCSNREARRLFAKHFSEEYDHHHFFQRALEAAGIDAAQIEGRTPLPSTTAIRNHMRNCGRRDPLAYAACSGFLESTGDDHARSHAFFERLTAHFDTERAAIIGPLADHARLDEGYQHSGMLHLVSTAIGPITRTRAEAALEAVRILVETLEVWSSDILRHYGRDDGLAGGVRRYRPLMYGAPADV